MTKKYKYILFAWCGTWSLIMGLMVGYGFIYHPDSKYVFSAIVYIIYAIIMVLGVRKISAKSRQPH
ncbi:hypothetical protein [Reichenbachiella sp.]|uniref:hypothetical protein n=1 Tax=Reichenbachiella sp. TaxID=2184521 RepID=UPI003266C9FD